MDLRAKLGVCQWFHFGDHAAVEAAVGLLHDLGVRHLRTGVSWADFHRPGGPQWYDWQARALAGFEVLLSIWHTPPSLAEGGTCASPPRRLEDYAGFVGQVCRDYGRSFAAVELWNEPNNRYKWDFPAHDPDWRKFGRMIALAARTARREYGKPTVLGGMIPVDHHWLNLMESYGALADVDVVAVHAFPGMWWADAPNWDWHSHWRGWADKLAYIGGHAGGRPVWVTETGLATWDLAAGREARHARQAGALAEAARAPADRVYWYSLVDLDPDREAIEGFHVDENEYHMGLVTARGVKKEAYFRLRELLAG